MIATLPYQLELDIDSHVYRLNGEVVPSVTHILAERNLYRGSEWWTEDARIRGSAVHMATQLHDENDLDYETLAPDIAPYLAGWQMFLADSGFVIELIEHRLGSEKFRFAGQLDRLGMIGDAETLIDIKTGLWEEAYQLQLAAYSLLLNENGHYPKRMLCVSLNKQGTYKVTELSMIESHRAQALFLSALSLTKWRASA